MKNITIIGDIHGKIYQYHNIIKQSNKSIQVGDLGFKNHHQYVLDNIDTNLHKVNFGNHDDYSFLNKPHSLGNYSNFDNIMSIRGALSIDKHLRKENVDWWSNEELTYYEMQNAIDVYQKYKPSIVITHDCPNIVRHELFNITEKSLTSNGLQIMFEIHPPDLWIFGHHHKSKKQKVNGTQFICLAELETYII